MNQVQQIVMANAISTGYATQTELSKALGYSQQLMSYKLRHPESITLPELGAIARKTRMPEEDIIKNRQSDGR